MIDLDELIQECSAMKGNCCSDNNCKHNTCDTTSVSQCIKKIAESIVEPEIDFDALWKGFKNYCDNSGCIGCIYLKHDNKYQCFKEFLKSKSLTAPQVDMDALRNEIYSKIVKSLQKTKSCPECGCKEYLHENDLGNGYRVCKNCKQEWWTDVDYSNKKYEIPVKRYWPLS